MMLVPMSHSPEILRVIERVWAAVRNQWSKSPLGVDDLVIIVGHDLWALIMSEHESEALHRSWIDGNFQPFLLGRPIALDGNLGDGVIKLRYEVDA